MTDCYLCGHPLLKGQLWKQAGHPDNPKEHANPADHLPTGVSTFPSIDAAVKRERERAAKFVEEVRDRFNSYNDAVWPEADMVKLAQRIRGDE